jgi:uncharacterized membrane protein (UPF0127 family)
MKRVVIFFILFCGSLYSSLAAEIKVIPLYIGTEKFMVEIADTPEKQLTGLMFREFIPDDFGMLFIHESEDYRSFWMKNCRVSLDIIFLDRNKQVINIHFNVPPCKGDPCKTYGSERPAQYVLELRGNRAKELNLKPGDTIFFSLDH